MNGHSDQILGAILATVGRQAFPTDVLGDIVGTAKQLAAYNMCDGTKSQSDIAKALKLDSGNFSRTVARWIDTGVLFRMGEGRDARLLHVYPLTIAAKARSGK